MIDLNKNYWDCECNAHYIHPKSDKDCKLCGATEDNQPDSRKSEVALMLDGYGNLSSIRPIINRDILNYIQIGDKEYNDIIKIVNLIEDIYPSEDEEGFIGKFVKDMNERADGIFYDNKRRYKELYTPNKKEEYRNNY